MNISLKFFHHRVAGALKMREWKMREHIAGVENAGVENAGATKYGKPSEKIL